MNSTADLIRLHREPINNREVRPFRPSKFGLFARLVSLLLLAPICIGMAISFNTYQGSGYQVYAEFDAVGDLPKGAPIEVVGVRIGTVSEVSLTDDGLSRVQMSIDEGIILPQDSIISIRSSAVRGEKVLIILPGKSEKTISSGETFPDTESGGQRPQEI